MDPDAVWDGEWGRLRDGCIRCEYSDRRRRGGSFGVNLGHPVITSGDFATKLFLVTLGRTCCNKRSQQIGVIEHNHIIF